MMMTSIPRIAATSPLLAFPFRVLLPVFPSPWSPLHAQLHQMLRARSLVPKHQSLLIAVSGGQDSLCLARLLLDLQPKWNWRLGIAHCNHGWRSDAGANAAYVQKLAQAWNLPYYSAAATMEIRSEAAAREWRYQALSDIAQAQKFAYVATGHTASDRAETLLYNLLRGSGTDGLQALSWKRELSANLWLIRPLLDFTRQETAQFCQTVDLQVWEDSTNWDDRYKRNRIRNELFPYLQTHFNPQAESVLAQTAELLQADVDCLEAMAQALLKQAIGGKEDIETRIGEDSGKIPLDLNTYSVQINRVVLQSVPLALQRRVMRQVLQSQLPQSPTFNHIEKLVSLITAPNRSRTDPFPGGSIAQVQNDWIVISKNNLQA